MNAERAMKMQITLSTKNQELGNEDLRKFLISTNLKHLLLFPVPLSID